MAAVRFLVSLRRGCCPPGPRGRVPAVDRYDETHGFAFWRMSEIDKVRYIAGFGKICWIDGAQLLTQP